MQQFLIQNMPDYPPRPIFMSIKGEIGVVIIKKYKYNIRLTPKCLDGSVIFIEQ